MKPSLLGYLSLALACCVSVAGAWSYEQVAGPGNWAWMELEVMLNGTICVSYQNSTTGEIYISRKDTAWHTDSLGSWHVYRGHHLALYPGSRPAVLLRDDSVLSYAVGGDSGWAVVTHQGAPTGGIVFLAFDSTGNPALLFWSYSPGGEQTITSASFRGDTWASDLVDWGNDLLFLYVSPPTDFRLGADNLFYFDWSKSFRHQGASNNVAAGSTGSWNESCYSNATGWGCISVAPTLEPGYSFCYDAVGFRCDSELVDSEASDGRLRVDALGRKQIVYRCGVLKYACKTLDWHIDTLPPEMNAATAYDFATDLNALPLVAFMRDSSIFLATGDAVGTVEAKSPVVEKPLRIPTIARGVLRIPMSGLTRNASYALLDIIGRHVLALHPGANDVSRIAPGVYFLRVTPDRQTHKVIIQP